MTSQLVTTPKGTIAPWRGPSRQDAEARTLRRKLNLFQSVWEAFAEPCFLFDGGFHQVLAVNPAARKWLGYAPSDLIGCSSDEVFARETSTTLREKIISIAPAQTPIQVYAPAVRKDGSSCQCLWHVQRIGGKNQGGILVRLLWGESDEEATPSNDRDEQSPLVAGSPEKLLVFSRTEAECRQTATWQGGLMILPRHDPLTGLADRRLFARRLARAFERAVGQRDYRFAVLFLDLDRFKAVNDTWGHRLGDRVLQGAARCLATAIRPGDLVARYGGDEFTVLLDHVPTPREAIAAARRILRELARPLDVAEQQYVLSASIGIAFFSERYAHPGTMLDAADRAMYAAKRQGGSRYRLDGGKKAACSAAKTHRNHVPSPVATQQAGDLTSF